MSAPRPERRLSLRFTGYEDFVQAFNAARQAAMDVFGPRWDRHPQAYIWARLPAAWVRVQVAGRRPTREKLDLRALLSNQTGLPPESDPALLLSALDSPTRKPLSDGEIGSRWSKAPRDQRLPVARFWPGGDLPVGPDYATASEPKRKPKPKLALVHDAEPVRPRRPSGLGLPSGRDRANGDFYIEPRWLVEALLRVERFEGPIHDPFCGGGNIVGACLERGLTATGSDLHDRGFGMQRDAFNIKEPLTNLIGNPPFARIEEVIRHFLPLVQHKLVLLARLNVLEGQDRRDLFRASPPARVWVSSRRASIPPGDLAHPRDRFGAMVPLPASGGSTAYAWVVWDRHYVGPTVLDWV
jgi:hypothetical protein